MRIFFIMTGKRAKWHPLCNDDTGVAWSRNQSHTKAPWCVERCCPKQPWQQRAIWI